MAFQSTEPPLHIHDHEDEARYILDGKMTLDVGDQSLEETARCFVFAAETKHQPFQDAS